GRSMRRARSGEYRAGPPFAATSLQLVVAGCGSLRVIGGGLSAAAGRIAERGVHRDPVAHLEMHRVAGVQQLAAVERGERLLQSLGEEREQVVRRGGVRRTRLPRQIPVELQALRRGADQVGAVGAGGVADRAQRGLADSGTVQVRLGQARPRAVGHGLPSRPICTGGTVSFPAVTAALAAVKNAGALQYANWPNGEFGVPFTHLPAARLFPLPRKVSVLPLKPNQMPTTAPSG